MKENGDYLLDDNGKVVEKYFAESEMGEDMSGEFAHDANFDELEAAFPSSIQGSLGIVRRIGDVSDKYKGIGGVKRYFVGDVIELASGEQVIVCTQFGASNTEKFVEHAVKKLGYIIEKV